MKKVDLGSDWDWTDKPSRGPKMSRELREAASELRRYAKEEIQRKPGTTGAQRLSRIPNLWRY